MLSRTCIRADFRQEYQRVGAVRKERFPGLPVTALTATATPRVQADVKRSLGIQDCVCFQVMMPALSTCASVLCPRLGVAARLHVL